MVAVTQSSSDSSCAAPFYVVAWARENGGCCARETGMWLAGRGDGRGALRAMELRNREHEVTAPHRKT